MTLKRFKRWWKKESWMVWGIFSILLLISVVLIYRSYAIYEEREKLDVIQGSVPNQFYDMMVSFSVMDESGNKTYVEEMPKGKNWMVDVDCDKGASGFWDYENWRLITQGITKTRTKCHIVFSPVRPFSEYGIFDTLTNNGNGLYRVTHDKAIITYTLDEELYKNLTQVEYRYAGNNPNNYVLFNDELWRIIGLVNTPEGQRIKIIRNESIGAYSWDSRDSDTNSGYGVNEWSQSDLMNLLNKGAYYYRTNGMCCNGKNNQVVSCDFRGTGLTDEAKTMIDMITWNLGSNGDKLYNNIIGIGAFYNLERSHYTGKSCNSGIYCNDTIERNIIWKGQVGLIYPSDYGYATSGGATINRDACFQANLYEWASLDDCYNNDWLYKGSTYYFLSPLRDNFTGIKVFSAIAPGHVSGTDVHDVAQVFPSLYLKSNVKILNGIGTFDSPFELSIE